MGWVEGIKIRNHLDFQPSGLCVLWNKAKLWNERKEVWGTFLRSITSQQRGFGDRSLHDLERESVGEEFCIQSILNTEAVSSKASILLNTKSCLRKLKKSPGHPEQSNLQVLIERRGNLGEHVQDCRPLNGGQWSNWMIYKKHLAWCWPPSIDISCCYSFRKKKKKNHGCRWRQYLSPDSTVPCKWLRSHQNPLNGCTWSFSLCDLIEPFGSWRLNFFLSWKCVHSPCLPLVS